MIKEKLFIFLILKSVTVFTLDLPSTERNAIDTNFEEKARQDAFTLTSPKDNPYAVMVIAFGKGPNFGVCSGSLLTRQFVLTAAHCLYNGHIRFRRFAVYAGGNTRTELEDIRPEGSQLLWSKWWVEHHKHRVNHVEFDVAIIKVNGAFKMTDTVNTVQIATAPWSSEDYISCKLTGFGIAQEHEINPELDYRRKTQNLQMKRPCECEKNLKSFFRVQTVENWVCSKPEEDYGLCNGDSGGGLICNGVLQGVASIIVEARDLEACDFWMTDGTLKCGSKNTMSVFTAIAGEGVGDWLQACLQSNDTWIPSACGKRSEATILGPRTLLLATTITLNFFAFAISLIKHYLS